MLYINVYANMFIVALFVNKATFYCGTKIKYIYALEYLFSNKKKWSIDICYNMNEP